MKQEHPVSSVTPEVTESANVGFMILQNTPSPPKETIVSHIGIGGLTKRLTYLAQFN